MSKWLVLPVVALAYFAVPVTASRQQDRDRDGLPDRWERRHQLSTGNASDKADPDRDRLRNLREYRLRTNPRRADTDRDRLSDGKEVRRHHTNPRKRDTDGDGYNDRVELRARTNPRAPSSHPDARSNAPSAGFPSPSSTGVPAGWTPARTRTTDLRVTQAGAVVQDVLLQDADLTIEAANVTIRRVKLQGGRIHNWPGATCSPRTVIEDSTIEPPPGKAESSDGEAAIGVGGYTARRVKIWRRTEGFRVGGASSGCGPVRIEDSFAKIVIPAGRCDLHSDGIQGNDGPALSVVNTTIDFYEASCGTAPFFVPENQGNTSANVDRLLVMGGGFPFRLGVPGKVSGLRIVNRSWGYGPIDVRCSRLTSWDASIVAVTHGYQVARTVRPQRCE